MTQVAFNQKHGPRQGLAFKMIASGIGQSGTPEAGAPKRLMPKRGSIHRFKRKRNPLAATDAKSDDAFLDAVAFHRMQQSSGKHRAGGADRMTMRDRTAFNIDDTCVETQVLRNRNCDRREGLVNLDALDIRGFQPARSSACLAAGTGPNPNTAGSTAPINPSFVDRGPIPDTRHLICLIN